MKTKAFYSARYLAMLSLAAFLSIGFIACNNEDEQGEEVPTPTNKLDGFTVNDSGLRVLFAPGNLQATYDGSSWMWGFAANQWDYIGGYDGNSPYHNYTGNNYINGIGTMSKNGIVDLFGWVGASCEWTGVAMYGISNSTQEGYNRYGNKPKESLKSDWGNVFTNSSIVWRTLTNDEWKYVFYSRKASSVNGTANARFVMAIVVGKVGVILFPDNYVHPDCVMPPANINKNSPAYKDNSSYNVSNWRNSYNASDWSQMETAGCVFLPAAGSRIGSNVYDYADLPEGGYWSSTPNPGSVGTWGAYLVSFGHSALYVSNYSPRCHGHSVRLVRQAE